jgi:peptide subunit release factor 1 (eRF1)
LPIDQSDRWEVFTTNSELEIMYLPSEYVFDESWEVKGEEYLVDYLLSQYRNFGTSLWVVAGQSLEELKLLESCEGIGAFLYF